MKKIIISIIIALIAFTCGYVYYYSTTPYDDNKKIGDYYAMFMDRFSGEPQLYETLNNKEEVELFINRLKHAKGYFEWGMGGSTFDSLKHSYAKVFAVESSKEWMDHMGKWSFIRKNIKNGRLKCFYINIGKTKDWGYPVDSSEKENFPNFSNVLSDRNISKNVDVVLVDGRFRVACALIAILNCNKDTVIMVHDFPSRANYHILLKYLDPIESAKDLVVFKIKTKVDIESVKSDYNKFKYNPE